MNTVANHLLGNIAARLNADGVLQLVAEDPPIRTVLPIAVADPDIAPGRQWSCNCTVAGNVTIKYQDATTHVVPIAVGYSRFPDAIVGITASTATAVFANHY